MAHKPALTPTRPALLTIRGTSFPPWRRSRPRAVRDSLAKMVFATMPVTPATIRRGGLARLQTPSALFAGLVLVAFAICTPALAAPSSAQAQSIAAEDPPESAASMVGARSNAVQAERAMQRFRQMRMADAGAQMYVAPFVSLLGGQNAELVLLSRFSKAFDVSIKAVEWDGRVTSIENLTLQPRQRAVLDLRKAFDVAGVQARRASVRVEHFGDAEMMQSWIVYGNVHGSLAMPLLGSYSFARGAASFWSLEWTDGLKDRGANAAYVLHNRAPTPLHVDVSTSNLGARGTRASYDLPPDGSVLVETTRRSRFDRGAITFEHDGAEGQLAVAGLVLSPTGVISSLPVIDSESLAALKEYSSAGMAGWSDAAGGRSPFLAIHDARPEGLPQTVTVDILEFGAGTVLQQHQRQVAPGEITVFDELPGELARLSEKHRVRLRVGADAFGVVPFLVTVSPDEVTVAEVELLSHSKSHPNGTYPLPSSREASTSTVILNIGSESAEIQAHIVTDRGEYALDPFAIPAGGAYDLDFTALIAEGAPDRIGRTISSDFEGGFFQWMSRGPEFDLLARTNVAGSASSDVIGFNCVSCCEEFPRGALYPDESYVFTGESAFFEPQVYVETCSGTTGPYPANVISRSFSAPISWSGTSLGTSAETEQDVSFFGEGLFVQTSCDALSRTYFASGPVGFFGSCQEQHNPGRDSFKSCQQQPREGETCDQCCDKQRKVGNCICGKLPLFSGLCEFFVGHAYRNCLENCAL